MGDLFNTLIETIKSRFNRLFIFLRRWTSWNFVRTQIITKIRDFFASLFNVRPRDKKDYYTIFGWMVSKKLVYALVAIVGVFCAYYLISVRNILPSADTGAIKTYSYNSIRLRFTDDTVRITAKDGHLAYEGQVSDGAVTGEGTLYNADGVVIYQGQFEDNMYQGSGSLYYDDGTLRYVGDFAENEFDGNGSLYYEDGTLEYEGGFTKGKMDGEGTLYRENGTPEYEGSFVMGVRSGTGNLYDAAGTLIYSGNFSMDEVVYTDFLSEFVSEVWDSYFGSREIYWKDDEYAVYLKDIGMLYYTSEKGVYSLDDELTVEQVIVLSDSITRGGKALTSISELNEYFGAYRQSHRNLTFAETVAMYLASPDHVADFSCTAYDYYMEVSDYRASGTAFVFDSGGQRYTFVSPDESGSFAFYMIGKEEEQP